MDDYFRAINRNAAFKMIFLSVILTVCPPAPEVATIGCEDVVWTTDEVLLLDLKTKRNLLIHK